MLRQTLVVKEGIVDTIVKKEKEIAFLKRDYIDVSFSCLSLQGFGTCSFVFVLKSASDISTPCNETEKGTSFRETKKAPSP